MKKQIILGFIAALWAFTVQSQVIQIEFKHFAGKEYRYVLVQGTKLDTIAKGKLDAKGKTTLQLPSKYKGYTGLSNFSFTEAGGLDLIVSKENFTVRCNDAKPDETNIEFIGSPENMFLVHNFPQQQTILEKARLVAAGMQLYTKTDILYQEFDKEQQSLNEKFKTIQNETAKSTLYAARFQEIINYANGVGIGLTQTPEQKEKYLAAYIRAKLDLDALYTSSQWDNVLNKWYGTNQAIEKGDSISFDDAKYMANRIKSNTAYTAFAEKVVTLMARAGKDELMHSFGTYVSQSGRVEKPNHNLVAAMGGPQIGMHAPDLILPDGKQLAVKPKTVLFFYESGCNSCENEMLVLRGNYDVLKSKGYEVISIAADVDHTEFAKTIAAFPWTQKYGDFKGHAGINFSTYAVIGTPTLFVIDEKGNVAGRYAKLVEAKLLN